MSESAKRQGAIAAALRAVILDPSELSGPRTPEAPLDFAERLRGGEFVLWHAGKDAVLLLTPLLDYLLPDPTLRAIRRAIAEPTVRRLTRVEAALRQDVPSAAEIACRRVARLLRFHRAHMGCPVASAECAAAALDHASMHIEDGDLQRGFLAFRASLLFASDAQCDGDGMPYVGGPMYSRLAGFDQKAAVWLKAWTTIAAAERMISDEDEILRGGAGQVTDGDPVPLEDILALARAESVSNKKAAKAPQAAAARTLVVFPSVSHLPKPSIAQQDRGDSPRALVEDLAERPMPLVPAPDPQVFADTLLARFPWARGAIEAYAGDLVGAPYARFRPRILVGPPGCGKTAFAKAVVEAAGLDLTVYSAAGQMDGGSFAGTSRQWGSWRLSTPAQAILRARMATVGIVIDEVEKAGTSRRWGRLDETILSCLEHHTARAIHDPAIEAPVDLSAVSYVLTANSVDGIVAPMRDRAPAIEWPAPRAEDLPIVAASILAEIRAERGLTEAWCEDLSPDELDAIPWRGGSMRPLRRMIDAVLASRDRFTARH